MEEIGGLAVYSGRQSGDILLKNKNRKGEDLPPHYNVDKAFKTINFPHGRFERRPVVLATYERMSAGQMPTIIRVDNVTRNGFRYLGQNEEAYYHDNETPTPFKWATTNFIAIEIGDAEGLPFDLKVFRRNVNPNDSTQGGIDHRWLRVNYGQRMDQPDTFAQVQSFRGWDPFGLRFTHGPNPYYIRLRIEEEQSHDTETFHVKEDLGVIVIGN